MRQYASGYAHSQRCPMKEQTKEPRRPQARVEERVRPALCNCVETSVSRDSDGLCTHQVRRLRQHPGGGAEGAAPRCEHCSRIGRLTMLCA